MPGGKHVDSLPLDRVGKPNAPRPSSKAKPTRDRDVNTYRKDTYPAPGTAKKAKTTAPFEIRRKKPCPNGKNRC